MSHHRTGKKKKNWIVLMLCSFEKVAAAASSQNMAAKRLAHLPSAEDKRSEDARVRKRRAKLVKQGIGIFSRRAGQSAFLPENPPEVVIREKNCAS